MTNIVPSHFTPVGQGVTHRGVPLYGHTDHQVDGAAEGDPDQEHQTEILTSDLTCTAGSAGRGIIKAATGDRNSQSCSELHPELQRSDEH